MASHIFNFEGGEHLAKIGASWFVSYMFYELEDRTHENWKKVSTIKFRINIFNRTREYHYYWLEQVINMNDKNLSKNSINLKPIEIKTMAKKILMKGEKRMTDTTDIISTFADKCMIVQIPLSIEFEKTYDAARRCWWADIDKAKKADYILAVANGIVQGVFKPEKWYVTTDKECKEEKEKRCKKIGVKTEKCEGKGIRIRFVGDKAPTDVKERYLNKEIPSKFTKKIVDYTF